MSKETDLARSARQAVARECEPFIPEEATQFIWHNNDASASEAFVALPQGKITQRLQPLSSSTGCDTAGWPDAPYNNPYLVFGTLILDKWASTEDYVTALSEVAKVDSAEWARKILQGMAWSVGCFNEEHINFETISSIEDVEKFRDAIINRLNAAGRSVGTN